MTTERQQAIRAARHAIWPFLRDNYPCQCGKEDIDQCPGEWEEAQALAELAVDATAADIWDEGYRAGRDEDDGGGRLHPNPHEKGA